MVSLSAFTLRLPALLVTLILPAPAACSPSSLTTDPASVAFLQCLPINAPGTIQINASLYDSSMLVYRAVKKPPGTPLPDIQAEGFLKFFDGGPLQVCNDTLVENGQCQGSELGSFLLEPDFKPLLNTYAEDVQLQPAKSFDVVLEETGVYCLYSTAQNTKRGSDDWSDIMVNEMRWASILVKDPYPLSPLRSEIYENGIMALFLGICLLLSWCFPVASKLKDVTWTPDGWWSSLGSLTEFWQTKVIVGIVCWLLTDVLFVVMVEYLDLPPETKAIGDGRTFKEMIIQHCYVYGKDVYWAVSCSSLYKLATLELPADSLVKSDVEKDSSASDSKPGWHDTLKDLDEILFYYLLFQDDIGSVISVLLANTVDASFGLGGLWYLLVHGVWKLFLITLYYSLFIYRGLKHTKQIEDPVLKSKTKKLFVVAAVTSPLLHILSGLSSLLVQLLFNGRIHFTYYLFSNAYAEEAGMKLGFVYVLLKNLPEFTMPMVLLLVWRVWSSPLCKEESNSDANPAPEPKPAIEV